MGDKNLIKVSELIKLENKEKMDVVLKELADIKYALDWSSIVAITDQRGVIPYVNDQFCEMSQYEREEILGQDHWILNSGYHSRDFIKNMWATIGSGDIWRGEIRNKAKDGSFYWIHTTIVPFLNERGKPYQYVSIRNDISLRKNGRRYKKKWGEVLINHWKFVRTNYKKWKLY